MCHSCPSESSKIMDFFFLVRLAKLKSGSLNVWRQIWLYSFALYPTKFSFIKKKKTTPFGCSFSRCSSARKNNKKTRIQFARLPRREKESGLSGASPHPSKRRVYSASLASKQMDNVKETLASASNSKLIHKILKNNYIRGIPS
uniref:Uncharacterized protein n=1 Tax=Sphaerodactylus townsendi TaxID=933632 RepID=A0ACB8EAJ3_9SAUR